MEPTSGMALTAQLSLEGVTYSVLSFTGREGLNELYEFTIHLRAPELVSPDLVLGKPAQLALMSSQRSDVWPDSRVISGVITKHRILSPHTLESRTYAKLQGRGEKYF